jgi:hypothetical protein
VNRVFLTGTLNDNMKVCYAPQGKRILSFQLWIDEGAEDCAGRASSKVLISGILTKAGEKPAQFLRLKANKIMLMEE